jgi:biotin carboxyl carrier protein
VFAVTVEMLDESVLAPPATVPVVPVLVPPPVTAPLAAPPTSGAAVRPGDVKSPLAGKVVSVDVKAGQGVREGQQVMTLEAMKMNTYVYAPKAGTVSVVHISPGDIMEEGAVLMTIV